MANDRVVIGMIARRMYHEELGNKLGINIDTEYGIRKLNEYLEEQRKSDELSASIHLRATNKTPGKIFSDSEIREEARKIERDRMKPYVAKAKRELELKKQQEPSYVDIEQSHSQQEIKIDSQYSPHKDSYTYRQILIGIRNEFLKMQKKLEQLSEYVVMYENAFCDERATRDNYCFDLYKDPLSSDLPELVLNRIILKKRLLEKLGLNYSPTRALMVKNNNGVYYPLRKTWFEDYQFIMKIKPGFEKEFEECVQEILNSDFAKYMTLSERISAINNLPITGRKTSIITPQSFGFTLETDKSQFSYSGRENTIEFASVRYQNNGWEPLIQEHLNYVAGIKFPREAFPQYHQTIIDRSISDERPIVLSEDYQPNLFTKFEIIEEPQQLVLKKVK